MVVAKTGPTRLGHVEACPLVFFLFMSGVIIFIICHPPLSKIYGTSRLDVTVVRTYVQYLVNVK